MPLARARRFARPFRGAAICALAKECRTLHGIGIKHAGITAPKGNILGVKVLVIECLT